MEHGPWRILGSREVYRDPWIDVRCDEVIRPDGADGTHCVVRMKPGVSVLPLDDEWHVYLTHEFHYAIGREALEVVSGGMEPGEGAAETAQRELAEELGLAADSWTDLGTIDPFTTIIASPTKLYLARKLRFTDRALEGTERIERVHIPFLEALAMVMDGHITHGPSCILLLKTARLLEAGE